MRPYRCPICGGTGKVARGFYPDHGDACSSADEWWVECRTCDGDGIVWHWDSYYTYPICPTYSSHVQDYPNYDITWDHVTYPAE